jgi:ketosteroid isomerase-like protein
MNNSVMAHRIHNLYAAFNDRNSDFVVEQMTPGVEWPRAFKGGFVQGQDAVRAYWEDQWREIDPRVDPVSIEPLEDGRVDVEVHQVVRDLEGNLIADSIVHHIYSFDGEAISRMEVLTED